MIAWRRGCEACHADAAPIDDAYHELIHLLLDQVEAGPQDLDELLELERQLYRAKDEIHDLKSDLREARRKADQRDAALNGRAQ